MFTSLFYLFFSLHFTPFKCLFFVFSDNVKGMQNDQVDRASVGVFIDLMSSNDEGFLMFFFPFFGVIFDIIFGIFLLLIGAELHESKSFDVNYFL